MYVCLGGAYSCSQLADARISSWGDISLTGSPSRFDSLLLDEMYFTRSRASLIQVLIVHAKIVSEAQLARAQ